MDPALRELVRSAGPPEEELAVIVRLADSAVDPPQARVVARCFGDVVTVRVTRSALEGLWRDDSTLSVKAPQPYTPEVMPDPAETDVEMGAADARPRPQGSAGDELTGAGTAIGALDWGLDIAHPDFRTADGRTRLLGLWDQRTVPGGQAEPYGYGRIFEPAAINAALRTADPYTALGYHPSAFDAGNGAHGTHTFSIAAGNGRGGGPVGYAPEADGVFVNLGSGEGAPPVPLGSSVQILEGIDFIAGRAGHRPLALNLSLGRHAGSHKGRSLVERALDHFVSARPGRLIAASCGNYFERGTHASFQLAPGERRSVTIEIDPQDRTTNTLDIWYPGRDRITVQVSNADLGLDARVAPDRTATLTDRGRDVARAYHRTGDPNTGDNQCSVVVEPSPGTLRWEVTLHGDDVVDGRVHLWVERDTGCRTCQSVIAAGQTDQRTTTGTIANGFRTVTVGAVDGHRRGTPLARFSSSGPTRDARRKPDLVAPGVLVVGARSTPRGESPGARYVRMSGTSMAAPAVTGVAALMFQKAGALPIAVTRRALLASCDPLPDHDPLRVGAGLLNPEAAVLALDGSAAAEANGDGGCRSADVPPAGNAQTDSWDIAAELVGVVEPPRPPGPRLRVAVVGAGLSGLMTARRLEAAGIAVTVFEAGERLGGRVFTRRDLVPGKTVEAGAELIGSNHPLWTDLARTFGLGPVPVTGEDAYENRGLAVRWMFGGRSYGRTERTLIIRSLLSRIGPLSRIGAEARDVDPRRPWTSDRAAEWDGLSVAARLRRSDLALDPIRLGFLELVLGNDQCAPPARQSYLGLLAAISAHRDGDDLLGYWKVTETHRCAGGNDQLVSRLAAQLADVRRCAPVRVVELSTRGARVGFDSGASCRAEEFDAVVLAGPPTAWPAVVSDAEPFRPEAYTMAHGPAVKHLNTFVRRFWEDARYAPSVLSDRIGSVWESTDRQATAEPSGFGLSVYSGGPYVRGATAYQAGLAMLYPGYRTQVRRSELVDWSTMPWIMTGNSVPAPGQVTTVARRLSEPFRGRLFFAGEHASPGFFGYMEGALEAGAYVADRIRAAAPALLSLRSAAPVPTLVPAGGGGGTGPAEVDPAEGVTGSCVPAAEPGPPGGGPHPVIRRGSRRPVVGHAQQCMNVFLTEMQAGTRTCTARGAEPTAFVRRALTDLAARGQLTLAVDCNFGGDTEIAVRAVQACFGLKRDGIVGEDTWPVLDRFLTPRPAATATSYRMLVDAGRNGSLVPGPQRWSWGPGGSGAVVLVNNDDDDRDGKPDNENPTVETGDVTDLTPLVLELVGPPDPALTIELIVDTPTALRIVDKLAAGGSEIVGPASGARHTFTAPVPARIELGLEGVRFAGRGFTGEVVVTARWTTGGSAAQARTTVRMAPWLVPNHLDPAETVFVVDSGGFNATFRGDLGRFVAGAGCRMVEVPGSSDGDIWMQDCMEFGYAAVPAKRLRTVLKNLRAGSLAAVPRSLLAPDTGYTEQGRLVASLESSIDFGGNLECTPPVAVRGRRFPAGRIYLGSTPTRSFDAEVREFLEGQVVQQPIELNTAWLSVGHVDEVLSFVPARDRKGFRMVIASPRRAYALLDRLAASDPTARMLLGRTLLGGPAGTVPVEQTVRDFLKLKTNFHPDASPTTPADPLRAYNLRRQADIDRMRTLMIAGLDLEPADIVDIPAVFYPQPDTPSTADALIAGMVNMLVVNGHAGVPKPFGPVIGGVDQFEEAVTDQLVPLGVRVSFLDCWDTYHVRLGEVHCGTNTLRTAPALPWWEFRP